MKLPPIRLQRMFASEKGRTGFVIVAEPLPIAIHARMTDAEHIERREAERAAIAAEWERIGQTGSTPRE
jgi:hypothetical protein